MTKVRLTGNSYLELVCQTLDRLHLKYWLNQSCKNSNQFRLTENMFKYNHQFQCKAFIFNIKSVFLNYATFSYWQRK